MNSRYLGLLLICCLLFQAGCEPATKSKRATKFTSGQANESQFLNWVIDNLKSLEEFGEGDMLQQVADRLNQWVDTEKPQLEWTRDPLVDSIPTQFTDIGPVKRIDAAEFTTFDSVFLQEAIWLRNTAEIARGGEAEELPAAQKIFDWTIRNIQLDEEKAGRVPHYLAEILIFGHGTAEERAWLFAALCRQQKLNVVMLALANEDGRGARSWLPAVLIDQKLYLFDCRLGLPIFNASGDRPATLAEVRENPALLRAMDLDAEHLYPVKEADLGRIIYWLEASPGYLSRRMKLVEANLVGKDRMRLSVEPTAIAEKIQTLEPNAKVSLWPRPYQVIKEKIQPVEMLRIAAALEMAPFRIPLPEPRKKKQGNEDRSFSQLNEGLAVIQQRDSTATRRQSNPDGVLPLRNGRFGQLRGNLTGGSGAKAQYDIARNKKFLTELDMGVAYAQRQLDPSMAQQFADLKKVQYAGHLLNNTATYWLGLITYGEAEYQTAIHFFDLTLADRMIEEWWPGARYNKARALEAQGDIAGAVKILESDQSPQAYGNKLLARRLQKKQK